MLVRVGAPHCNVAPCCGFVLKLASLVPHDGPDLSFLTLLKPVLPGTAVKIDK